MWYPQPYPIDAASLLDNDNIPVARETQQVQTSCEGGGGGGAVSALFCVLYDIHPTSSRCVSDGHAIPYATTTETIDPCLIRVVLYRLRSSREELARPM